MSANGAKTKEKINKTNNENTDNLDKTDINIYKTDIPPTHPKIKKKKLKYIIFVFEE